MDDLEGRVVYELLWSSQDWPYFVCIGLYSTEEKAIRAAKKDNKGIMGEARLSPVEYRITGYDEAWQWFQAAIRETVIQ